MANYRTIFLSDVHLLSENSKAERLTAFLDSCKTERYVLVGDILDAWRTKASLSRLFLLTKKEYPIYCPDSHLLAIKKLLSAATKGVKVDYVIGNHDDFLLQYIDDSGTTTFGNMTLHKQLIYGGMKNRKILILHGHEYDFMVKYARTTAILGMRANLFLRILDKILISLHLSKSFSLSTSADINSTFLMSMLISAHCERLGYEAAICGHSHKPGIDQIGNIQIYNCGDWTTNCTALVETEEGKFEILKA